MGSLATETPAVDVPEPPRIAVIGARVAGAACAAALLRIGLDVTVFDKSRGVGGRMATRRTQWADENGIVRVAAFDHGCQQFTATGPRFRVVVDRAVARGAATRWNQRVYARFPAAKRQDVVVPTPDMPALCRHLLTGVPLQLGDAVTGFWRCVSGWMLQLTDGRAEGPFEHVVLAIPAPQAAALLRGHVEDWAAALASVRMAPCWTLMALTDDVDWPWDAAEVGQGVLSWIARGDRVPGRDAKGLVPWVAHAAPAWSLAHLEEDPTQICEVLRAALGKLMTGAAPPRWHHFTVHRWRYARCVQPARGDADHWWSTAAGIGVCGDAFGDGSVEAAWCSGDALASAVIASRDASPADLAVSPEEIDESISAVRHWPHTSLATRPNTPTGETSWVPLDAHS